MTKKLSGRCACGAVSYDCQADPIMMFNCHCRDCQRASGSAYAAIVIVQKADVRMHGELRYHKVVGNAGSGIERGFCGACGSQLLLKLDRFPTVLGLQAGNLDDPSIYRPTEDVFTSSAQPWDCMDPAIEKHTHEQPT